MAPKRTAVEQEASPGSQILREQVALLYQNSRVALPVTAIATLVLARLEWGSVTQSVVTAWAAYMYLVAFGRYVLSRSYQRRSPAGDSPRTWGKRFAIGAGMAGLGWGAAGVLLYPETQPFNQLYLIFILGGMMLGAASTLAPRRESYLAFIVPSGLAPAARLAFHADEAHGAMAVMAVVFTLAILYTTSRTHETITSSLTLQFENAALVKDLQAAMASAEALNEHLESRVQERTAELSRSSEQLRAEIAQREQVEEQLLRARKLESLGVLAGGIAHDFNNFLAAVQGNLELARSEVSPNDPVQATLNETENACKRAAALSAQLLTFSKGGSPVRRLVSIADLIREAVALARAGAQTRFDVSVADDLRAAEVDSGQIGQVLHNILLNARQAMSDSGLVEVRAENSPPDEPTGAPRVRISITDYGSGIPKEVLPLIFDPYFTTKPGGTGLGLATAYSIVTKHEGSLTVHSRIGYGSVFVIELPASDKVPVAAAPVVNKVERGAGRILVMDDEDALRKLVKSVLGNLGYEVETAADGAEAIDLFEKAQGRDRGFDAVILDLTVSGGMGGVETAALLREMDPRAKLIVSSGYSDSAVLSDLPKYGFADMIPKPWTLAQVSQVVAKVVAASRASRRDVLG